mgnify:FL=1
MAEQKWVYYFGDCGLGDKGIVGGKGAGLSEMTKMGLPIPTGFTISTASCNAYAQEQKWPAGLREAIDANLAIMESKSGKKFGDAANPLLVSVRSGAKFSMPGMMDTVLNLGLNPEVVAGIASKNARFAQDSYRRFINMFGDVVMEVPHARFEAELSAMKAAKNVKDDVELSAEDLDELCNRYLAVYEEVTGSKFPTDPREQLDASINAVFRSWGNQRAVTYRNLNKIAHDLGTAVNVQEMVYGNMGNTCATGVAFTRNPSTGENARFGEYLINAQGEDVVAGIRTPKQMIELKEEFPECAAQLYEMFTTLENHMKDMQDIEFTIENGKLYLLQTRNGKRTAPAAVKMAVDMVREGLITKQQAILRIEAEQLDQLLHPHFDPKFMKTAVCLAQGLPASPGAAVGEIVFTADEAVARNAAGKKVLLVRNETSPEDIHGMAISEGILTARGGMTSHAAVVARGMNITCVAGCAEVQIDEEKNTMD